MSFSVSGSSSDTVALRTMVADQLDRQAGHMPTGTKETLMGAFDAFAVHMPTDVEYVSVTASGHLGNGEYQNIALNVSCRIKPQAPQ